MSGHVLGRLLFARKIVPLRVWIWAPSDKWFLGLTRVNIPNGIMISSAAFAGPSI